MTAGIDFDPAERDAIAAEVNLSVLKRSDTAIKAVLKSANHVCLYHLEDDTQWRRLDVEGSLFVVERHLNHQNNPNRHTHRIVIINRKSLNNYTDDVILGNKHLELADQMIMYSNSKNAIIGIWFYEKAQALQIFDLLQRITNGENPQPAPDHSRPKRTPKRPAKPADQSPTNQTPPKPDTVPQTKPDNSLERFFPNLKLTNGVAGHQVPQNAKESMFESHAVSTMSTSPNAQKTATAFKPTAEIDAAIITASEAGMPAPAPPTSTTADAKILASQAIQLVKGNPKTEPKRKTTARPRTSPKPMTPYNSNQRSNSHSPVKINGVAKTNPTPNSKPMPKQPPSMKPNASAKVSTFQKTNPVAKQLKQPPKSSPPPKRAPAGKRGQNVKGNNVTRQHVVEKPTATSVRAPYLPNNPSQASNTASNATRTPQIQLLTKPKTAADLKTAATSEKPARGLPGLEGVRAPPKLAVPAATSSRSAKALTSGDAKPRGRTSSPGAALPSTPNAPISVEVPGAPRAKQIKKPIDGGSALPATSSSAGTNMGKEQRGSTGPTNPTKPQSEEEAMRQMRNMTMRQAHAEKLKMQEAQMFAMQPQFPFVPGDLGLGQGSTMMGGGLAGPGGGPSGFTPSLHPQMALMMQQQHQLFMQQQLMAQHHQRQMQLQAGQAAQTMGEPVGNGIRGDMKSGFHTVPAQTKEESADDLMRMLNVERPEGRKTVVRKDDEKKKAEGVGASVARAEKVGGLGTSGDKLDKVSFRAVVQRMLTDRKLFDSVYEHYLNYHDK